MLEPPEVLGGRSSLEGRAPCYQTRGVATPALCCGATRHRTLDMGPGSPSWVRRRTREVGSLSLGPECLSLLPVLTEGGRLNSDPRAAFEELGLPSLYLFFLILILFICGCAGFLLLCGLFSSCRQQGLLSSCGVQASHCSGFSLCGAPALGIWAQ